MENFDEIALTWDNDPRRVKRAKVIAKEIVKTIPNLYKMDGFEYGCGTGLLSFNLRLHLKQITLGDNSKGMLEVLKQKIKNAEFNNMTPIMIDLSKDGSVYNGKFDIIYTLLTLHHILDTDQVIDSFSQMLRPLGYICIADLEKEDGSFHGEGFTGHNGFNRYELAHKLMKYGFEVMSWKICYKNTKKFEDGTIRKYPLFLMIAKKYVQPGRNKNTRRYKK